MPSRCFAFLSVCISKLTRLCNASTCETRGRGHAGAEVSNGGALCARLPLLCLVLLLEHGHVAHGTLGRGCQSLTALGAASLAIPQRSLEFRSGARSLA